MVTSAESDIQDIVGMLRDANDEKIRVAKNVLKELLWDTSLRANEVI